MMKMLILTLGTTLLSAVVISNAYFKKQQFYPTVVYLLNSSRSLGVLYLQAFLLLWLITKALKKLFFGTLRAAEVEHLIEHSWYAVLETFILLAAFHQDLNVSFVTVITLLFVLKSFHWLASDRIDYMERSPIITLVFHLRAITLLLLLATVDIYFIRQSWHSLKTRGASVEVVFGLEYAIMLLSAVNTFIKYVLHTIDLQSEDPWDNKAIYLRYVDIVLGFLRLCLYVSYMSFMLWVLFIPLHIARRIYITAKHFQKSVHDVVSAHQAIRNLNTLYADATVEELESANNVCIICREEMVSRCKKLPCNHIFHTSCLRSWFQRQQTCPTCRMDVLNSSVATRLAQARRQQQGGEAQGGVGNGGGVQRGGQGILPPPHMMFPPPMMPAMFPGMVPPPPPPPPPPPHPQQQQQQWQGEEGQGTQQPQPTDTTDSAAREQQVPGSTGPTTQPEEGGGARGQQWPAGMIPPMMPPMMPPPPFMPPPFMMPPSFMPPFAGSEEALRSLSDDELRALEGMERANVEARIALLRNVQKLLDTAVTQLNQYSTVMAAMGPATGPGFPGFPAPPGATETAGTKDSVNTDSESAPRQPAGLFDSQGRTASVSRPQVESQVSFTFSAADLSTNDSSEKRVGSGTEEMPQADSSEETDGSGARFTIGGEEEVKSKLTVDESVTSAGHADMEVRQRRLQRFYSLPATSGATAAQMKQLKAVHDHEDQLEAGDQSGSRTAGGEEDSNK